MILAMEFHPKSSISATDLMAMCRRAFGAGAAVKSARELGGGTFNTTFLIQLEQGPVIVRIAPPPGADLAWHEKALMRREVQIQPFFAAIATLMPRTLLADFTHQVIDRDYIIQSYLEGERWDDIGDGLPPEEQQRLWEQFGSITRSIHQTSGTTFGGPHPDPTFERWSEAVLYRLEQAILAMRATPLDVTDLQTVVDIARRHRDRLDEVRQPRLLHGDLWLFNILVRRLSNGPQIVGILDADRAWWGDPLADWTMFVLAKSESPEMQPFHEAFWRAYGPIEQTPAVRFRKNVYEAMHVSIALTWAVQHNDADTVQRGRNDLREITANLQQF